MRRLATATVLLAIALGFPTATAEPVTGSLTIDRPIVTPSGSVAEGTVLAAVVQGNFASLVINASRMEVTIYERDFLVIGEVQVPTQTRPRSFPLTGATVEQIGPTREGAFAGVHPRDIALSVRADRRATAEAAGESTVHVEGATSPDLPESDWYSRESSGPQTVIDATGSMQACGSGAFKLYGVDVAIKGLENASAQLVRTGYFLDGPTSGRSVWVYVSQPDGCLNVAGAQIRAATREANLAWRGEVTIHPLEGALRADGTTYEAGRRPALLDGDFSARLIPDENGQAAVLFLTGDLWHTSLASVPVPRVPIVPAGTPALGLLVIGAVLGVGGAGAYAWHRRRVHPPIPREERLEFYFEKTDTLREAGQAKAALGWIRKARALAPKDPLLAHDEASLLETLMEYDLALVRYEEAHNLSSDGGSAFSRAALLNFLDAPVSEIRKWACLALDRTPALLYDLDGGDFGRIRNDAAWRAKLQEAAGRLRKAERDDDAGARR